MNPVNLYEAYKAVYKSQPPKGTPERIGHTMGINYMNDAIGYAEILKHKGTIDTTGQICIERSLNICLSTAHNAFPSQTKETLRGIHNRFHQRYRREIHCLKHGLGM